MVNFLIFGFKNTQNSSDRKFSKSNLRNHLSTHTTVSRTGHTIEKLAKSGILLVLYSILHAGPAQASTTTYTVPPAVTFLRLDVKGAGGGGGGGDLNGRGGAGGWGAFGTAVFRVTPGEVLTLITGEGGKPGTYGNCASPGQGGSGWQAGGRGGSSGCNRSSGSGGGGGGASAILRGSTVLIAAGGGGGGDGASQSQDGFEMGGSALGQNSVGTGSPGGPGSSSGGRDGSGGGGGGGGCTGGAGGASFDDFQVHASGSAGGSSCANASATNPYFDAVYGGYGGAGGSPLGFIPNSGQEGSAGYAGVREIKATARVVVVAPTRGGQFSFKVGQDPTETITVGGAGGVSASNVFHESPLLGTDFYVEQTNISAGFNGQPVSISCVDTNAANNGNPSGNLATLTNLSARISGGLVKNTSNFECTFTYEAEARLNVGVTTPLPHTVAAGSSLDYTVSVANAGGTGSGSIYVNNKLPPGVIANSVTAGPGIDFLDCGKLPTAPGAHMICKMDIYSSNPIRPSQRRSFTIGTQVDASLGGNVLIDYVSMFTELPSSPLAAPIGPGCTPSDSLSCNSTSTTVNLAGATVTTSFGTTLIAVNQPSTLTITLSNRNTQALTGVGFVDNYPGGLVNASPPMATTTCPGGTVSLPSAGSLQLAGASVPGGGSCTVTVHVTSATPGSYTNTVPAAAVTAGNGSANGTAASATLTVLAQPVVRVKKITLGGFGGNFAFVATNLTGNPPTLSTSAINSPSPASPTAIEVVGLGTDVTLTEASTANFLLRSATCTDAKSATTGNPSDFGNLSGRTLTISSVNLKPGADITCTFTSQYHGKVSGRLFGDTGNGGGIANDGIANGGEAGLPGVVVVLNNCAATVYASVISNGNGQFDLAVPSTLAAGSDLCVETAAGPDRDVTGASVGDASLNQGNAVAAAGVVYRYSRTAALRRIAFQWPGTSDVTGLNFGSVPASVLSQPGIKTSQPGGKAVFSHFFVAGTAGTVSFSVASSVSTPASTGWTEAIFADPNCTGELSKDAARLYPPSTPQTVVAGQRLCVLLQQTVPVQVPLASSNVVTLSAGFVFANASPAMASRYTINDLTTVNSDLVQLRKEVRNVTQNVENFGTTNQARPGDLLEYRIHFTNNAASPVINLVINDTTPAYTSFVGSRAGTLPAAVSCVKATPANPVKVECGTVQPAGGHGAISWNFTGPVPPGGEGEVVFQVKVD